MGRRGCRDQRGEGGGGIVVRAAGSQASKRSICRYTGRLADMQTDARADRHI